MITVRETKKAINGKEIADLVGLSTDTKPTNYGNGSIMLEMDTGKLYAYDEEGEDWEEQNSGSGGGTSDLTTATVTFTFTSLPQTEIIAGVFVNENALIYPKPYQPIVIGGAIAISPTNMTMVLYKGHGELAIDYDPDYMTATGNATWVADNEAFDVTGDCTIAFSE